MKGLGCNSQTKTCIPQQINRVPAITRKTQLSFQSWRRLILLGEILVSYCSTARHNQFLYQAILY
jgi:hypothetical protein